MSSQRTPNARKEYEILLPPAEDVKCRTGCCFQACGCVPTSPSESLPVLYCCGVSANFFFPAESCAYTFDCGKCLLCFSTVSRVRVEVPWVIYHGDQKCCIFSNNGVDNPCCEESATCCSFGQKRDLDLTAVLHDKGTCCVTYASDTYCCCCVANGYHKMVKPTLPCCKCTGLCCWCYAVSTSMFVGNIVLISCFLCFNSFLSPY
jgi:hypothetical protein